MIKKTVFPFLSLFLGISLSVLFTGCEKKPDSSLSRQTAQDKEEKAEAAKPKPVQAVCIFDNLAYWKEPSSKSEFVGRLRKGEMVTWLGETEKGLDTNNKERDYLRIRDSADREAWVMGEYIVPDAKSAAVLREATIYTKKSLISRSDEKHQPLEILAVVEEEKDWVEVISSSKSSVRWIKPGKLTYEEADISVAYQASRFLDEKDKGRRKEKLEELLSELIREDSYKNSAYIPLLQVYLDELTRDLAPEPEKSATEEKEETGAGETKAAQ